VLLCNYALGKHPPSDGDSVIQQPLRLAGSSLSGWTCASVLQFPPTNRSTLSLQVSNTALNTSENILMCAPTGAGKTNVAMLAILHTMSLYRNAETGKIDTSKFKIVYVAPMKVF
jgi:pre-mRNA-splicing helicase BRR2